MPKLFVTNKNLKKAITIDRIAMVRLEEYFNFLVSTNPEWAEQKFDDHIDDLVSQFISEGIDNDKDFAKYLKSNN